MKKLNMSRLQNGENKQRKRRKKSFTKRIFRLLTFFLIIALFFGCARKDNSLVSVTYQVSINSDTPHNFFIAYRDSVGYVTLYAEENWSMQVSLPRRHVASLLVISQKDLDLDFENMDYMHSLSKRRHAVFARIIQGGNVVSDSSDNLISISVITSAP